MLSVAAYIGQAKVRKSKPGLSLSRSGEDHRSVAVRAKRARAGSLAKEKRANGTIEHNASLG